MDKPITPGLKTTFLVHFVVGLIVGLAILLIPLAVADLLNYPLNGGDPYVRLLGAATLGFAASSLLGYLAHEWREVKIVVQAEIVWTLLASLLFLWFVLDGILPAAGWLNFIVMALFFVAFLFFYWREETMPVPKIA